MTNKKHNHKQSLFDRRYYLTKGKNKHFLTLKGFHCININNQKIKLNCYQSIINVHESSQFLKQLNTLFKILRFYARLYSFKHEMEIQKC